MPRCDSMRVYPVLDLRSSGVMGVAFRPAKPVPYLLSIKSTLTDFKWDFLRTVKTIVLITRDHMEMIVPDVLISCGFIMLPKRNPIAWILCLHRQRNIPAQCMDF